jgi:hypothetical protein
MSLADFILGLAMLLVDVVLDILWSKIVKGDVWRGANSKLTSDAIRKASVFWRASGKLQDRVPASRALAQKWAGNPVSQAPTWWKGKLEKIFADKMSRPTDGLLRNTGLFGLNLTSKWVDHFAKSWVVSPFTSGLIFQNVALATGIPRTSVPSIAFGRAGLHVSFFGKDHIISVELVVRLPGKRPRMEVRFEGKTIEVTPVPNRILISTEEMGVYIVWHGAFAPAHPIPDDLAPEGQPRIEAFVDGLPAAPMG